MLAIILAGGKGTRMKSSLHKTLHKIGNKPIIRKIYDKLIKLDVSEIVIIVGDKKEQIISEFKNEINDNKIKIVEQKEQLGTAHAVKQATAHIEKHSNILVINGDMPLIKVDTMNNLINKFKQSNLDICLLTTEIANPKGYGRIIKQNNNVVDIIEEVELTDEQRNIKEINSGVYLFKNTSLLYSLDNINNNNKKGEYYITDSIKILNNKNSKIDSFITDSKELQGVNDRYELYLANRIYYENIAIEHIYNGVNILNIENTYIEDDVKIGENTTIYPNTYISDSIIGNDCTIIQSNISKSCISDNVVIKDSYIESARVEDNVLIGPFAHIRPDTHLMKNVKIGNFVEIKKSTINNNTKCNHLTYIGDSNIGKDTNIGAGTITCNYDGKNKHTTTIGDNCFIGSQSTFIAPVNIEDNVLIAAGSVITKNVPKNALAFGRAKQVNKENYYKGEN